MSNIIITRISTPQAFHNGQFLSIETQIEMCEDYCRQNNIPVDEVKELCTSAKNLSNIKLYKDILKTPNSIIIFANITRFSRNLRDGLNFIEKAKEKNIVIHFAYENLNTNTEAHIHQINTHLNNSDLESKQISRRVTINNRTLKAKGWQFGRPPSGYHVQNRNGIRKIEKCNKFDLIKNLIKACRRRNSIENINTELFKVTTFPKTTANKLKIYDGHGRIFNETDKPLPYSNINNIFNEYNVNNERWNINSIKRVENN